MNGAFIIETRILDFKKIIENHRRFLPDGWEITFFGSKENEEIIERDFPEIRFIRLPQDITINFTAEKYNKLITTKGFWLNVPYEKVLVFQHDSQLLRCCVDDFIEWDYIGAPWGHFNMLGGNGGLSLRTVSKMVEVIDKFVYNPAADGNEDLYFCKHLPKIGGKIAPKEIAQQFSVETVFYPTPVGCHAPEKYLNQQQLKTLLG
jgi:hypothetical protein